MRSLRLMTPGFENLGELTLYTSLQLTRRHFGTGEFELHVPEAARIAQRLAPGVMLFPPSAPEKMMCIEDVTYKEAAGVWTAKGCTLDGLTRRRLMVPTPESSGEAYLGFGWDRITERAESVFKHFVRRNLGEEAAQSRRIPGLVIAQDLGRGITIPWQGRFDVLSEQLQKLGEYTDMGWDIRADLGERRYVFDVVPGRDLAVGNPGVRHVVLSLEMGNATEITTELKTGSLRNLAYVGGAGEDESRLILTEGESFEGFGRREIWVDAGSVDSLAELTLLAQRKLEEVAEVRMISATVSSSGAFAFGRDWDLGDRVTIRTRAGESHVRIIEVTEVYEPDSPVAVQIVADTAPVTLAGAMARLYGNIVR